MALESLLRPLVLVPLALLFVYFVHARVNAKKELPDSLPWTGTRNERFPKLRANLREWKDARQHLADGYARYNKQLKAFVTPNSTFRPEVIIPREHIHWLIEQPDSILDTKIVHTDMLALKYMSPTNGVFENFFHEDIVRRDLTRQLGALTADIGDELLTALSDQWGTDTENWKDVCVYETVQEIVTRTSNRLIVGLPLCRNAAYLRAIKAFAQSFAIHSSVIRVLIPDLLKPLLAPLVAIPTQLNSRKCNKFVIPLVQERLAAMKRKQADPELKYEEPNDLVQWILNYTGAREQAAESEPANVAARIVILNFAAIHTSTFSFTNTLFDLLSTDPAARYVDQLRAEAVTTLGDAGSVWSKAALARLVKADSAIRESLRYTGLGGRGLIREVMPKEGITLPSGQWVPQGTRVGAPIERIHHDERYYDHADAYEPLRFVEKGEKEREGARTTEEYLKSKTQALVTTSDTFVAFGHGRHACPGRFFAAQELKLLLAFIVLHYDMEPLAVRPPNLYVSDFTAPPFKATIRVRRRAVSL
ncbi:cytochrome P450 [Cryomyces antarcticus]